MFLRQIFDSGLAQYGYLVGCQKTGDALVIDPERDVDVYERLAAENGLTIRAVAETHIHADFVSGARELAEDPDVHVYVSAEGGPDWSYAWTEGRANTQLLGQGDCFMVGNIRVAAVHTPGHTPEHLSYLITDLGGGADEPMALATGDFLFVGDVGRPDLLETAAGKAGAMAPAAQQLWESLRQRLAPLADYVQVLPGHGAGSACGKALGAVPTSTLGYERRFNRALQLAAEGSGAFVQDILSGQPDPPLYFATMKRVNRDGPRVTGGVGTVPELGAAEFTRLVSEDGVAVLDGRGDREAFANGHVAGAIHAPLNTPFFQTSAGSYLGETDRVLLVLDDPADVDGAARGLYRIGFDQVVGWISVAKAREAGLLTAQLARVAFPEFNAEKARAEGEILDVRTTGEFALGHLDGAQSIPYTRLAARLDEIPEGRKVFIHCGSGKRAGLAASFLQGRGYDVVFVDGICAECERIALAEGVPH